LQQSELSQWLCHDDSAINFLLAIIIILFLLLLLLFVKCLPSVLCAWAWAWAWTVGFVC